MLKDELLAVRESAGPERLWPPDGILDVVATVTSRLRTPGPSDSCGTALSNSQTPSGSTPAGHDSTVDASTRYAAHSSKLILFVRGTTHNFFRSACVIVTLVAQALNMLMFMRWLLPPTASHNGHNTDTDTK